MLILTFSTRLCELMRSEEISKRYLSNKIGVSRNAILNWCDGRSLPRYDTLIKLADFFKVSIDYLVGISNDYFQEIHSEFSIENVPKIYKQRLSETLKASRMSEYKLAKLLEVEQGVLSKWKKNPHLPETSTLIKIAKILNCSLDYLLSRS